MKKFALLGALLLASAAGLSAGAFGAPRLAHAAPAAAPTPAGQASKCGRGGCPAPVATTGAGSLGGIIGSNNPLNAIGAWANADVDAAIAASTKYSDVQDQVGAACFGSIKTLAAMIADHPLPLTLKVATDIEYARLVQGELNILCRNPSCAQVWSDMANAAQALSVAPLGLSFTSICGKVPVVGLSLANASPTPTPTATPTPAPAATPAP